MSFEIAEIAPSARKSLRSTEIYTTIEQTIFELTSDELIVIVFRKPEEIKTLQSIGFEYVCKKDDLVFLRKSK